MLRSNTGVPLLAKKWKPRIGKLPSPGMERGVEGMREVVRSCSAAMDGICDAVLGERKESAVTS